MVRSIVIYVGIYQNGGIGNLLRMNSLSEFIKSKHSNTKIDFIVNDSKRVDFILNKGNYLSIKEFNSNEETYDIALFDSIKNEEEVLRALKKKATKCIAFDYFNYNTENVDVLINLYNHFPDQVFNFKGEIFQSAKYAILRDSILLGKETIANTKNEAILITFGGEDPRSNTLKILKQLDKSYFDITILVGKLNKDFAQINSKYKDRYAVHSQVNNIEDYYQSNNIIICGGGTSMLEALYFGKVLVVKPQNENEENFINYISQFVPIFKTKDLYCALELAQQDQYIKEVADKCQLFIDGRGKQRILDIITKILN